MPPASLPTFRLQETLDDADKTPRWHISSPIEGWVTPQLASEGGRWMVERGKDKPGAAEMKQLGNKAFSQKNFEEAITHYSAVHSHSSRSWEGPK